MTSVRLRSVTSSDVDWVFDACQDRDIQRWTQVPRPYERTHAHDFATGATDEYARWAVQSIRDDVPTGVISIHGIEDSCASIGYWTVPDHRNRGYTVEAIRLVRDELMARRGKGEVEVDSMSAWIASENRASRAAIERAGFELSKTQLGPAVEDLVVVESCLYVMEL